MSGHPRQSTLVLRKLNSSRLVTWLLYYRSIHTKSIYMYLSLCLHVSACRSFMAAIYQANT